MPKLQRSKLIGDATLELHDTALKGVVEGDSKGLYWPQEHHIDLGERGGLQTLLHEGIHAATHKLLEDGTTKSAKNKISELIDLYMVTNPNSVEVDIIGHYEDTMMEVFEPKDRSKYLFNDMFPNKFVK